MKTSQDPRHIQRQKVVKALFALTFNEGKTYHQLAKKIMTKGKKLDKMIKDCAPEWPIEQINKVDLSILRLALFEITVIKKEPVKVIIDEAVELAKEFGSEASPSFVNGVLGTILKRKK